MNKPTNISVSTWVNLVKAQKTALTFIETALKQAELPTLEWYDILLELERVEDKGIRPFELRSKLLLPQYGVSRLVNRLEKAGYLKRQSSNNDKRGQVLFITQTGKEVRKKMWAVYAPAIEQVIGGKITSDEAQSLKFLLAKLFK